ncbi:lycopene cyclase (CrtL-type) [Saccharothrix saharensis]|uniref:Lycopene cyclase (CrtL-type) n=1 Tax=Saccharothrix saharensis TaxID=571190 RepID=A0A543JNB0_9PSEU|nr:lycopene cyclase family protein [Saccharothrix saharensis]TQM84264.1 lycopene cyclase (CrtL-type) [Saccharothrix saharensis]
MDVVVVGGGPAGRALARACAARGLGTTVVDPNPARPWRATYAAWADELPDDAPVAVSTSRARAVTTAEHLIPRGYAVLDNEGLRRLPDEVRVVAGRVVDRTTTSVTLAGGRVLTGRVVDASGALGGRAAQTAVGVVVPAASATPFVGPDEALIMDWRKPPAAATSDPTFLYAIPVSADEVLLEETSLARRPGLPLAELRLRLHARLAAWDIAVPEGEERVRIPLDGQARDGAFGAAAGWVHPATGYSVAVALRRASVVADALAHGREVERSAAERAVRALRLRGLAALLALPPDEVPEFFNSFFELSATHQRAYLGGPDDLRGTVQAMLRLFGSVPWVMRGRLAFPVQSAKSARTLG